MPRSAEQCLAVGRVLYKKILQKKDGKTTVLKGRQQHNTKNIPKTTRHAQEIGFQEEKIKK